MADRTHQPSVLILGASGLIGRFVTDDLRTRGFRAIGVARTFAASQKPSSLDLEMPILPKPAAALASLIGDHAVDVIVNCLGVLQDGPGSDTGAVHRDFVARLLQAIGESGRTVRLIHISIPGVASEDLTAFATTKRAAEALIMASNVPYAILRPGFVIAPSAYGGSAMIRALAAFPVDLPAKEGATPFQPVAIEDVAETIAWLAVRDPGDSDVDAVTWDLMQARSITLGAVIEQFRFALGTTARRRLTLPSFLLDFGATLGDLANRLGWRPPMRATAVAELRRGVAGDPRPWMDATGIGPKDIVDVVGQRPATIQDKWFARLFLIKALVIASLALFWIASGLIALVISFPATTAILTSHGFAPAVVAPLAAVTSLMDISIGCLIATRRTAAFGLSAGIVVALGYMAGTAVLTPDLWIEPLGALVKTGPAIVLMAVALLTLDNR